MIRIVRRAVSVITGIALASSLVLPAFAAPPLPTSGVTINQSSTNSATIVQAGAVTSGPAAAIGGTAESGSATLKLEAEQKQVGVQVAAGVSATVNAPESTATGLAAIDQTASNWAGIEQTAVVGSGAAAAGGECAQAYSGDAEVELEAEQNQVVIQVGANAAATVGGHSQPIWHLPLQADVEPENFGTDALAAAGMIQDAGNQALIIQGATAQSGAAVATEVEFGDFAYAASGDVEVEGKRGRAGEAEQTQLAIQVAANVALPFIASDAEAAALMGSLQFARNQAQLVQDATAISGGALALGEADAHSGDAEIELDADQFQIALQGAANIAFLHAIAPFYSEVEGVEPVLAGAAALAAIDQVIVNTAIIEQTGFAKSGAAGAIGGEEEDTEQIDGVWSEATTPDVEIEFDAFQLQAAIQIAANVAFVIDGFDGNQSSLAEISQFKDEYACIVQDATVTDLGAVASGGGLVGGDQKSTRSYGGYDELSAEFDAHQLQLDLQIALVVGGELFWWFDGGYPAP